MEKLIKRGVFSFAILFFFIFTQCKERSLNNPYDTDYALEPPELTSARQISENEFYITWAKQQERIPYIIIYKSINSRSFQEIAEVPASLLYFLDTSFSPDSSIRYAVASRADKNESEQKIIESTSDKNPYGQVRAQLILEQSVQLNWECYIKNIKAIRIQKKALSDDDFTTLVELNGTIESYRDNNISLCTRYFYRLQIIDTKDMGYYLNPLPVNVENVFKTAIEFEGDQGAASILKTGNGTFIIFGNNINTTADCMLMEADSYGKQLNSVIYENSDDEECTAVCQSKNGSIIMGSRYKPKYDNWTNGNARLRKIDAQAGGYILWSKNFTGNNGIIIHSIAETSEGDLILGGYGRGGAGGGWLVKTDNNGEVLWTNPIDTCYGIFSVLVLSDGNYLVTGHSAIGSMFALGGTLIAKVDTQGDIMWRKYYGYHPIIASIQNSENSYISITEKSDNPRWVPVNILNSDSEGNVVWIHEIRQTICRTKVINGLYPASVLKTHDGQILFCGLVNFGSYFANDLRMYLRKIDQQGGLLWEKLLDSPVAASDLRNNVVENEAQDLIILSTQLKNEYSMSNDFALTRIVYPGNQCGE